ncbi:DUF4976 domain-containing protein, partial [candidate division KSB1 bacterium]|nr:DUF4976 domain-containing protein [candidate division KSB1 bacterium]
GRGSAAKEQEMSILQDLRPAGDLKLKPEDAKDILGSDEGGRKAYKWNYERMTKEQQEAWDRAYNPRNENFNKNKPSTEKELTKWKYQRYIKDYLRCVASVDENVGRLLDYLDQSGLAENTVVFYTSDQGFYLGEHGWFDKRFMYEESFSTPLLVRWKGVVQPGSASTALVQNVDFAQTFLEIAEADIPEDMQGRSLVPILKDKTPEDWRDAVYYHYFEYPAVHQVKRHYGIRTDRYKLIHFYFDVDEWELYDLKNDPHEMQNIYDQPEYQETVRDLKIKLKQLREKYGDTEEVAQRILNEDRERYPDRFEALKK